MKTILAIMVVMIFTVTAKAQTVATGTIREDSTSVGTVFKSDSVYIGNDQTEKWLEIANDGAVTLYVAFGNDTTAGHFLRIKSNSGGTAVTFFIARVAPGVKFIRTRAASSTCIRRIKIGRR